MDGAKRINKKLISESGRKFRLRFYSVPFDVHSGRVARELGLLSRTQDDWKAVEELTANLRILDSNDPVKYDFALFGMGVHRG